MQTQSPDNQSAVQQALNMIGRPAQYPTLIERAIARFGVLVLAIPSAADYQAQQIVALSSFVSAPGNAERLIQWWGIPERAVG